MRTSRLVRTLAVVVLVALGIAGFVTRKYWILVAQQDEPTAISETQDENDTTTQISKILLSDQAILNLQLVAKSIQPQTYWKNIQVPGMVVDRPGRSDRGVVSPVTGVVTKINHFPGDTVRIGESLFTIQLLSESLSMAQSDLFKATQDIRLAQAQRQRMAAAGAAIPEARVIEIENQITRLEVAVKAYRQELMNRGLVEGQINAAAEGRFVSEISIIVPPQSHAADSIPLTAMSLDTPAGYEQAAANQPIFEVQELKVDLGQQVQAGQTLCLLANHQMLAIEGRAFRDETSLLERSVKAGWPVDVDFQEDASAEWPSLEQEFRIRHLSNTIDPVNRTFAFLIPLDNQSRVIEEEGRTQMLWRFRPGQKLRILVRVENLENVFVLPAEALARDEAESFVFTQNVNTFERIAVRVLYQDRQNAVIANDGSLLPGMFVVQSAAAQLNRMTKTSSSGVPKGYHIHADGSLHKNEDEGN